MKKQCYQPCQELVLRYLTHFQIPVNLAYVLFMSSLRDSKEITFTSLGYPFSYQMSLYLSFLSLPFLFSMIRYLVGDL